jgi:hypothetical protein
MNVKFGVVDYRYNHARKFKRHLTKKGEYSINVGDCVQSLTVRRLLQSSGIPEEAILSVNRDALPSYKGPAVKLVMNGCFYSHCFPIPKHVEPIFIGFNTSDEAMVRKHKKFFRQHEPIGCRDVETTALLTRHGIRAFTSGCLTMTLPTRSKSPTPGKVFIVGGAASGILPDTLLDQVPEGLRDGSIRLTQRMPMRVFPMGDMEVHQAESVAEDFLHRYRDEARLVITPLLHAASPCLGMGIPVVLARIDQNSRFSAIRKIIPVHTPENFSQINWDPEVADVSELKSALCQLVRKRLLENTWCPESMKTLSSFYDQDLSERVAAHGKASEASEKSKLYRFLHLYWLRARH